MLAKEKEVRIKTSHCMCIKPAGRGWFWEFKSDTVITLSYLYIFFVWKHFGLNYIVFVKSKYLWGRMGVQKCIRRFSFMCGGYTGTFFTVILIYTICVWSPFGFVWLLMRCRCLYQCVHSIIQPWDTASRKRVLKKQTAHWYWWIHSTSFELQVLFSKVHILQHLWIYKNTQNK